jgi:hypothetical protein
MAFIPQPAAGAGDALSGQDLLSLTEKGLSRLKPNN